MATVIRVAFVFVLLMVVLRVLGKRELSNLSPFELVLLMLIPELFQQALMLEDFSMTNAVIGLTTIVTLVMLTSILSHRFAGVHRAVAGEPTVLAYKGRFIERAMNAERVQPDDVYAELRKSGLERLSQARWVVLEDDGRISVVPGEPPVMPQRQDDPLATA